MKEIEYFPSSAKFKFGDGRQVTTIKHGKHCKINAEIAEESIPLLWSK